MKPEEINTLKSIKQAEEYLVDELMFLRSIDTDEHFLTKDESYCVSCEIKFRIEEQQRKLIALKQIKPEVEK